ncbi:hypothetical protein ACU686_22795 [Yinghuangia aomiensis]
MAAVARVLLVALLGLLIPVLLLLFGGVRGRHLGAALAVGDLGAVVLAVVGLRVRVGVLPALRVLAALLRVAVRLGLLVLAVLLLPVARVDGRGLRSGGERAVQARAAAAVVVAEPRVAAGLRGGGWA